MKVGFRGFLLSSAASRLTKGADNLKRVRSAPFLFSGCRPAWLVEPGEKGVALSDRELEGYALFSLSGVLRQSNEGGLVMAEAVFVAPRTEEMTEVAISGGGALVTGLAEGVVIKFAPGLGALQPVFTWGTLLGVPLVGAAGALFTKGMIGDLFKGIAAAGLGILGYSLPALIAPYMPTGAQGARQLSGQQGVKQLPAGPMSAPQRAQSQVRAGSYLEF
jgi:hypothetical protein